MIASLSTNEQCPVDPSTGILRLCQVEFHSGQNGRLHEECSPFRPDTAARHDGVKLDRKLNRELDYVECLLLEERYQEIWGVGNMGCSVLLETDTVHMEYLSIGDLELVPDFPPPIQRSVHCHIPSFFFT